MLVVKQKSITNKKVNRGQSSNDQNGIVISKSSKKRAIKKSKTVNGTNEVYTTTTGTGRGLH